MMAVERQIECTTCGSHALNKYGSIQSGKQRYICLVCGRQFTPSKARREIHDRPFCPVCGKEMHCYKRESGSVRFRCSAYPACKSYLKVNSKEGHIE